MKFWEKSGSAGKSQKLSPRDKAWAKARVKALVLEMYNAGPEAPGAGHEAPGVGHEAPGAGHGEPLGPRVARPGSGVDNHAPIASGEANWNPGHGRDHDTMMRED